ncbi:tetratricopeptide repeat protein [Psychromonas ossibalaenae]|uniref:tetratricopeptide repeat protein n=1 Tax=Psychromonas ossibalaenae TaxID=444922 RepID=UPI0003607017|nr:SEL1-like repeat protein [Psychromonas ossibalaenae]
MNKSIIILLFSLLLSTSAAAANFEVIQLYSQDELNKLININQHLQRVKADECQLVEDIEAHAVKIKEPSYTYLWGDMLAWGVCVDRNASLGMHYIRLAAKQGLLAAIEQLGRYYDKGILVEEDKYRAVIYYREAALQGFLKAQLNYVRLLINGYGSPIDYEDAYRVLFVNIIPDPKVHQQAKDLLARLAEKMPEHVVKRARKEVI